eukprot:Pgem_evm1s3044
MKVIATVATKKAHPFGDHRSVDQAFPGAVTAEQADPFLMLDDFTGMPSGGLAKHEDEFPIDWHPHAGQDVLTYLKAGVGRHGDSLGHRETFKAPGMQWMAAGSGVYHAEGGGTPKGVDSYGFQIWVNVPSERKFDDPRYGTVPPEDMPLLELNDNSKARVLAGEFDYKEKGEVKKVIGEFKTTQPVLMVDFEIGANGSYEHNVASNLDNCMVYIYKGNGKIQGKEVKDHQVMRLDASSQTDRNLVFEAGEKGLLAMVLAGKRINEPIKWHGPLVMNTAEQVQEKLKAVRAGTFPPVRVDWDFYTASANPEYKKKKDEL